MTDPLSPDDIAKITASAVRKASGRFHGYVEQEDVSQVAQVALLEKPRKVEEWILAGDAARLYQWIFKNCMIYGHKEKAAAVGYRMEDLFFYSLRSLRELIPAILEAWSGHDGFEWEYPDRTAWLDVSEALSGLTEAEYQIVWWAFKGDPEEDAGYANVAGHLGITVDAGRQRLNRVLRRMQESLGGENPRPRRKARSNAAAMAETHQAWDGEA